MNNNVLINTGNISNKVIITDNKINKTTRTNKTK